VVLLQMRPSSELEACCGFCGAAAKDREHLVAGPELLICEQCVVAGEALLRQGHGLDGGEARCSFCALDTRGQVFRGHGGIICAICMGVARCIIAAAEHQSGAAEQ
jgi:ClpX C4-type zinc finger